MPSMGETIAACKVRVASLIDHGDTRKRAETDRAGPKHLQEGALLLGLHNVAHCCCLGRVSCTQLLCTYSEKICALVMLRSETTSLSGRPSSFFFPEAWSRKRARIESRVTPGRIMSSRGGVTISTPAFGDMRGARKEAEVSGDGKTSKKLIFTSGRTRRRGGKREEKIHGSDFGQAVFGAEQPQDLLISECGGLLLGHDAGGVVRAELVASRAARPRAHVLCGRVELDGFEAGRVVGADGGAAGPRDAPRSVVRALGSAIRSDGSSHDKEENVGRSADTKTSLGADHRRANVCPSPRRVSVQTLGTLAVCLTHIETFQARWGPSRCRSRRAS